MASVGTFAGGGGVTGGFAGVGSAFAGASRGAAGRIETRGADANEPLASNKSSSGRARNRRVELTLLAP